MSDAIFHQNHKASEWKLAAFHGDQCVVRLDKIEVEHYDNRLSW